MVMVMVGKGMGGREATLATGGEKRGGNMKGMKKRQEKCDRGRMDGKGRVGGSDVKEPAVWLEAQYSGAWQQRQLAEQELRQLPKSHGRTSSWS